MNFWATTENSVQAGNDPVGGRGCCWHHRVLTFLQHMAKGESGEGPALPPPPAPRPLPGCWEMASRDQPACLACVSKASVTSVQPTCPVASRDTRVWAPASSSWSLTRLPYPADKLEKASIASPHISLRAEVTCPRQNSWIQTESLGPKRSASHQDLTPGNVHANRRDRVETFKIT